MSGHKTTHTQLERFRLIDSMLSDGEVIPFEKILDSLRLELHDDLLSDSSLRRDFRYMKKYFLTLRFRLRPRRREEG